ncbi:hypothetical protein KR054_004138 [Drosophila jambulina]|nr:hypothetical protein KR054_004138 [Drosophila jambulina]
MGDWGKELWKRICRCNLLGAWPCRARTKDRETVEEDRTEDELWQEYYAPYLHFLPFEEICTRLETSLTQGLTQEVAALRLERNGRNTLPFPPKRKSLMLRYLCYCFSVMGVILLVGSLVGFYLHHYVSELHPSITPNPKYLATGWSLLIIFFLIGLMRVLYEDDNIALLEAIEDTMPMYCTVIREGKKEIILTQDVVIGDVLPISYCQRLPADLRFFNTSGLEVDNVALTGASDPWHIYLLASDEQQMFTHSKIEYMTD